MLTPSIERICKAADELFAYYHTDYPIPAVWPDVQTRRKELWDAVEAYRREAAGIILNKAKGGSKL